MSDRIIAPLVPGGSPPTTQPRPPRGGAGTPPADPAGRRELDLRRTPAPGPGEPPPIRLRHLRRYCTTVLDHKGRLTCGMVFDVLGWEAGTRIDIAVHAGTIVVRGVRGGEYRLNARRFLHIPVAVRRWCSFGERERELVLVLVLVRAVPELSVLVICGQERLDRALPDPRRLVDAARVVGFSAAVRPTGRRRPGERCRGPSRDPRGREVGVVAESVPDPADVAMATQLARIVWMAACRGIDRG